jgi:hypothetical protein
VCIGCGLSVKESLWMMRVIVLLKGRIPKGFGWSLKNKTSFLPNPVCKFLKFSLIGGHHLWGGGQNSYKISVYYKLLKLIYLFIKGNIKMNKALIIKIPLEVFNIVDEFWSIDIGDSFMCEDCYIGNFGSSDGEKYYGKKAMDIINREDRIFQYLSAHDVKNGDILQFGGEYDKIIYYYNKGRIIAPYFTCLEEEGMLPPSFVAIQDFPIDYWIGLDEWIWIPITDEDLNNLINSALKLECDNNDNWYISTIKIINERYSFIIDSTIDHNKKDVSKFLIKYVNKFLIDGLLPVSIESYGECKSITNGNYIYIRYPYGCS